MHNLGFVLECDKVLLCNSGCNWPRMWKYCLSVRCRAVNQCRRSDKEPGCHSWPYLLQWRKVMICGGDCVHVHTSILQGSAMAYHFQGLSLCIQITRLEVVCQVVVTLMLYLADVFSAPLSSNQSRHWWFFW